MREATLPYRVIDSVQANKTLLKWLQIYCPNQDTFDMFLGNWYPYDLGWSGVMFSGFTLNPSGTYEMHLR